MLKKILFIVLGIFLIVFVAGVLLWPHPKNQNLLEINFAQGGNVSEYKIDGFSWPEPDLKWTDGQIASIEIPGIVAPEKYSLLVAIDVIPFVTDKRKSQNVDVLVNDKLVKKLVMDKPDVYKFVLPQMSDSEKIVLKFKFSNLKSPKELKLYDDARKLGFAMKKLTVLAVDARNPEDFAYVQIGKEISFKRNGNSQKYIGDGWSGPEQHFTWTDGNDAYVNMFVENVANKNLQLNVYAKAIFDETDKNQKVTVFVNDTELTTWEMWRESNIYSVLLPESVVGDGALKIRFHIHKPHKLKSDTRDLGMSVKTIDVSRFVSAKYKIKIARWIKNTLLKDVEIDKTANTGK